MNFKAVLDSLDWAAREQERERCAQIAENPGFIEARDTEWDEGVNFAKQFIAAAIRAQSLPAPDVVGEAANVAAPGAGPNGGEA